MNSVTKLIGLVLLCLGSAVFAAPAYLSAESYHAGTCELDVAEYSPYGTSYQLISKPPPYIGIPHDRNITLMTHKEFMDKLEPVLGHYIDFRSRWAESEGLQNTLSLNKLNSRIYIFRSGTNINSISYATSNTIDDKTQRLTDHDKMAMLELIDIFVQDKQKSNKLLDELYKRYLGQVELIVDGQIIVFLEYQGKYFSLKGYNVNYHPIKRCNYQLIDELVIQ